jgi:hypothetical protein
MSTLDLSKEHEFHYSDDEDCTEEGAYEPDQGAEAEAFSNGEDSHSSGEEGQQRGVQQVDYSQLELAQRVRAHSVDSRRGGRPTHGAHARIVAEVQSLGGEAGPGGQEAEHGAANSESQEVGRGTRLSRKGSQRGGGRWQHAGALASLPSVNIFTSQAPGSSRLHPLPQPASATLPTRLARTRQKRIKKNGNWSNEQLQRALAAVDEGKSMKKAAAENHIPYSSFRDWCYGKPRTRKRGVKAVLTPDEEAQIVNYLVTMCDRGYGLSPSALKMKVYEITKTRSTPFKDGIPGGGWMRWFRRRHPELTVRTAEGLESARARALCPENVQSLYDNLTELYNLYNYPPERIWNCDESGAQAGNMQVSVRAIAQQILMIMLYATYHYRTAWLTLA